MCPRAGNAPRESRDHKPHPETVTSWRAPAWLAALLLACLALTSGCIARHQSLPSPGLKAPADSTSRLAGALAALAATNDGRSAFYVLEANLEAFLARTEMIDAAERTLDVQSYIMRGDVTGLLLAERILQAADRGVQVRLLVDDVSVLWKDASIARLDGHPNVELRVFNPFIGIRTSRWLVFYDFFHAGRLTRRMHNKLFAADNALAIVGGRNLGDEYFTQREGIEFMDLDVLVTGPAVAELGRSFEEYWQSEWAFPVAAFRSERETAREFARLQRQVASKRRDGSEKDYRAAMRSSDLLPRLIEGTLPVVWANARVVYDRPNKVEGDLLDQSIQVSPEVWALAETVSDELIVLSPYFVPGEDGVELFSKLRQRGVRVRIITNSMKSTDVLLAHKAYTRYRRALLDAGVELYELKPTAIPGRREGSLLPRRGKQTSLHAKSFIFDRQTVFVGSMNLDYRAHFLNTELGLLIESPELAKQIAELFEYSIQPRNSYQIAFKEVRVLRSPKAGSDHTRRQVTWLTEEKGIPVRFTSEPHAGICLRMWGAFLLFLPLEGQL